MKSEEFDIQFGQALEQSLPPFSPQVKARALEAVARWGHARPRMRPRASTVVIAIAAVAAVLLLWQRDSVNRAYDLWRTARELAPTAVSSHRALTMRDGDSALVVLAARRPVTDGSGRVLSLGSRLALGAAVHTGKGGRVTLVTRRGSEFTLNANTELVLLSRDTANLRAGEIYCRSRAGEIRFINTPAGRVELLGTVIDVVAKDGHSVAVTVIAGKVRLSNSHGQAVVPAGRRSLLVASRPPTPGGSVSTFAATTWYTGHASMPSGPADILYPVKRGEGLLTEIWAMKADGSGKHRLKTYLGYAMSGKWVPGQRWFFVHAHSVIWSTPDFAARRAHSGEGQPIVDESIWLLDTATGQDVRLELPREYEPRRMEMSPDGKRLAFCESGVWVYDMRTGEVRQLVRGSPKTIVGWAPDSRRLAASASRGHGGTLVIVDTDTGGVTDLQVQALGGVFSPDGTKLAYIKSEPSGHGGARYSLFVLDLEGDGEPVRISPEGEGAREPRWSPDGTRVAYLRASTAVIVAQADGSEVKGVYMTTPAITWLAWTETGDAVYVAKSAFRAFRAKDDGVRLVAADGSGVKADLGGNVNDSILPPAQREQTEAALRYVQEAVFQYGVGNVKCFEGRPDVARTAFQTAADIFAALPWTYPLADLSLDDVRRYADQARTMAERPASIMLAESCRERLRSSIPDLLLVTAGKMGGFPSDLGQVERWTHRIYRGEGLIGWIPGDSPWINMIFRCPTGARYVYRPPAGGGDPRVGDVLITCPIHPANRLVWDEDMAGGLRWRRELRAREE